MSEIVWKVSTDALREKAQEIQTQIASIESAWNQIADIVDRSRNYWAGDASEVHLAYRKDIEEDAEEVLQRLREHPTDLLTMAGVYEAAEQEAMALAAALPDDVIE